jgi:hypothetical protein
VEARNPTCFPSRAILLRNAAWVRIFPLARLASSDNIHGLRSGHSSSVFCCYFRRLFDISLADLLVWRGASRYEQHPSYVIVISKRPLDVSDSKASPSPSGGEVNCGGFDPDSDQERQT